MRTPSGNVFWACPQVRPCSGKAPRNHGRRKSCGPLISRPRTWTCPSIPTWGRDGVKKEYTLLDYKVHFDKMSVFQRPKDSDMLGGLRNKIADGTREKISQLRGPGPGPLRGSRSGGQGFHQDRGNDRQQALQRGHRHRREGHPRGAGGLLGRASEEYNAKRTGTAAW